MGDDGLRSVVTGVPKSSLCSTNVHHSVRPSGLEVFGLIGTEVHNLTDAEEDQREEPQGPADGGSDPAITVHAGHTAKASHITDISFRNTTI